MESPSGRMAHASSVGHGEKPCSPPPVPPLPSLPPVPSPPPLPPAPVSPPEDALPPDARHRSGDLAGLVHRHGGPGLAGPGALDVDHPGQRHPFAPSAPPLDTPPVPEERPPVPEVPPLPEPPD